MAEPYKVSWKIDHTQNLEKLYKDRCMDEEFQAMLRRWCDESLLEDFKRECESIISNDKKP